MDEKVYYYIINGYNLMTSNVAEKEVIIEEWNSNHYGKDRLNTIERITAKDFYYLLSRRTNPTKIMFSGYNVED